MDIPTVTILEDYLNAFSGIVITVSHDRYFLDNVVDRIFEFDGNGSLRQYEGGYTDYREAKERRFGERGAISSVPGGEKEKKEKPTGKDWKQNRPTKLKFTYKEQREYETIDDDIAVLEEKIEKLDDDMVKMRRIPESWQKLCGKKKLRKHSWKKKWIAGCISTIWRNRLKHRRVKTNFL